MTSSKDASSNGNSNSKEKKSSRVGVADYFGIVGIGQKLVWMHAEKDDEEQQKQTSSNNEEALPVSAADGGGENEEAWWERFHREIVEVAIVTVRDKPPPILEHPPPPAAGAFSRTMSVLNSNASNAGDAAINKQDANLTHAQQQQQQQRQQQIITLPSCASTDQNSSVASLPSLSNAHSTSHLHVNVHEQQQHQYPHIRGAASDVTSLTGGTEYDITIASSTSEHQHFYQATPAGTTTNPLAIDGWTVLSQTPKAGWQDKVGPQLWTQSQIFDANLDPINGLLGHFRTAEAELQKQIEQQQQQQHGHRNSHNHRRARSGDTSSSTTTNTTPLKDLRRRMQSGWPRMLREATLGRLAVPQPKFYLAYRRRAATETDRPAISNLRIYYVKLHKTLVIASDIASPLAADLMPPTPSTVAPASVTSKAASVISSGASSLLGAAALVGRVAKAGKQVVRERVRSQQHPVPPKNNDETSAHEPPQQKTVPLHLYLGSPPEEFEEWCIPPGYQQVKVPPAPTSALDVTIPSSSSSLVGIGSGSYSFSNPASPSSPTSQRSRYSRNSTRTFLFPPGDDATVLSGGSGVGVEAVADTSRPLHEASHDILPPHLVLPSHIPAPHDIHHLSALDDDFYLYIPIVATKRQRLGDEERFHEDPGLVDISVSFVNQLGESIFPDDSYSYGSIPDEEEEELSPGMFSFRGKTPWSVAQRRGQKERALRHFAETVSALPSKPFSKSPKSEPVQVGTPSLLVRHNLPFGFCDAPLLSRVLDRFPDKNYKGLPLPQEELPMFCYPTGCRLHRARFSEAPLPQYYGFVLKNEQGDSIYVSCISFMEPLTQNKLEQLKRVSIRRQGVSLPHRRYWERQRFLNPQNPQGGDSNFLMTGFEDMATFENKTICLISQYPFWTAFHDFLSHLHIMSGSTSELPLERCISHLLLTAPVPKPGGPAILVPLPTLNIPMVIAQPALKDLPLVDLPFEKLVSCLGIPTIVTIVLGFLALERKVIVISTNQSLVLEVCELLRALLFPFELYAPYVPRLTETFRGCIDFMGPIFVGIHDDGTTDGLAAYARTNMPEDSMIVDLDHGVVDCHSDSDAVGKNSWGIIPAVPRTSLVSELDTLCRDAGIIPGKGRKSLDAMVDGTSDVMAPDPYEGNPDRQFHHEPLDDRAVRDSFLRFFCSILGAYERFLVVPDVDFATSGNDWFDEKGFLASVTDDKAAFLGQFCSTQMFQSFIQRRTEASDIRCLFFDECLAEFHSTTVAYGRLGGDVEQIPAPDSDRVEMLYSLLVDQSNAGSRQPAQTVENKSFEVDSKAGSDTDSSVPASTAESSAKASDIVVNQTGDWVTVPSAQGIQKGSRFMYCQDGNPCFPDRLNTSLFLPSEPGSWLVEKNRVSNPQLTRTEKEVEECERRRKQATSYRGLQTQRRCLWQLPKLMGSHVLGTWLLCVPTQIGQDDLSSDQQSTFLLRALGALRQLGSKHRIIPDEAAYRALMVACGRTRNDRRLEIVRLFEFLQSDGILPSAVTLGQYTKALAEGHSKATTGTSEEVHGVEVTESASRDLRIGKGNYDAEAVLTWMDTNLAALEDSGRRWRRRNASDRDGGGNQRTFGGTKTQGGPSTLTSGTAGSSAVPLSTQQVDSRMNTNSTLSSSGGSGVQLHTSGSYDRHAKKRSSNRSWLPVVYSSSIVPSLENARGVSFSNDTVGLVAIWSRCKVCNACGYIPLEEEVQAGWDVHGGEHSEIPGAIHCPRCGQLFVPMLGYKTLTLDEAMSADANNDASAHSSSGGNGTDGSRNGGIADFGELPPQIGPTVEESDASYVTYVSPPYMRRSLERYIAEHGEDVLDRDHMQKLDPELFYNFWWYCARFSLPLPFPVAQRNAPKHLMAFAAWDREVAVGGCTSCAKALEPFLVRPSKQQLDDDDNGDIATRQAMDAMDSFESFDGNPLLSRFDLKDFYPNVWDHPDMSQILVLLVEACETRDFKAVVECVMRCNARRQQQYGTAAATNGSDVGIGTTQYGMLMNASFEQQQQATANTQHELDCYRTVLYLAKYQCASAFHAFFPTTLKACKGYHFWCPNALLPIFDRLIREAVKRLRAKDNTYTPLQDVSEVALGFRCVFGHLI